MGCHWGGQGQVWVGGRTHRQCRSDGNWAEPKLRGLSITSAGKGPQTQVFGEVQKTHTPRSPLPLLPMSWEPQGSDHLSPNIVRVSRVTDNRHSGFVAGTSRKAVDTEDRILGNSDFIFISASIQNPVFCVFQSEDTLFNIHCCTIDIVWMKSA